MTDNMDDILQPIRDRKNNRTWLGILSLYFPLHAGLHSDLISICDIPRIEVRVAELEQTPMFAGEWAY